MISQPAVASTRAAFDSGVPDGRIGLPNVNSLQTQTSLRETGPPRALARFLDGQSNAVRILQPFTRPDGRAVSPSAVETNPEYARRVRLVLAACRGQQKMTQGKIVRLMREVDHDLDWLKRCARRSESRPVGRSESRPPGGGLFYALLI